MNSCKWNKRLVYLPGTKVYVLPCRKGKPEGGILLTVFDPIHSAEDIEKPSTWKIPRIMLRRNRKIIYGFECWWIPEEEVSKEIRSAIKAKEETNV